MPSSSMAMDHLPPPAIWPLAFRFARACAGLRPEFRELGIVPPGSISQPPSSKPPAGNALSKPTRPASHQRA